MRFKHPLGSAPNFAANSAVGPVSAPRIPLPAASLNCRQQSDLSMIYNLRGRFSGRSEVFLPASGANLTLCTYPFLRHARESGHPGATDTAPEALGPRLRGGDEEEKIGVIWRMAQMKPASSRAIAAVTTLAGLPLRASLR